MVGEFPELQGLMGMYYAREAGLPEAVALAARDHYSPLGPSDDVPREPVSVAVALADKIDTLTGFWAIDEKPTGSKDPFALRRAALGVIRLVLGNGVRAHLNEVVASAMGKSIFAREMTVARADDQPFMAEDLTRQFPNGSMTGEEVEKIPDLLAFFHDRLKVYLRDQGIRHDVIDACLAMPHADDLTLLVKRARALAAFLKTDDGTNLLQGFKRANNILTQAEAKDGVEYSYGADIKYAATEEERALFRTLDAAEATIAPAVSREDFDEAMLAMAALRAPIDTFFSTTQINAGNQVLRRNRLNLLHRIRAICSGVADLTRIEG
jgi:glycyl-tRNA synthetase beta chain